MQQLTAQLLESGWTRIPRSEECGAAIVTKGKLFGLACEKGATWRKDGKHDACAQHAALDN